MSHPHCLIWLALLLAVTLAVLYALCRFARNPPVAEYRQKQQDTYFAARPDSWGPQVCDPGFATFYPTDNDEDAEDDEDDDLNYDLNFGSSHGVGLSRTVGASAAAVRPGSMGAGRRGPAAGAAAAVAAPATSNGPPASPVRQRGYVRGRVPEYDASGARIHR
jgi:hypothetical protein